MVDNKDTFVYRTFKKKNNRIVKIALSIVFLFIIFFLYLISLSPDKSNTLLSVAGIVGIIALLNVMKLFDKDLDEIERTWGKGSKAELSIMKDLEKIKGCKIVNDFKMDRGNIDHVCISSTGIFAIETKSIYGVISYGEGKLKINGRELEKDFLRQTRGECYFLDKLIKEKLKKDYYIVSILVFANAKIDTRTISGPVENVWVCQKGYERKVIEKNKDHLTNEEIDRVYNLLLEIKKNQFN